jgi:hypothetical protein
VYGQTDKKEIWLNRYSFFHCGSGKGYLLLGDKNFWIRKVMKFKML